MATKPLLPEGPGGVIQIRPQATPVDTFVRPVAPGASQLGQLAAALSSVAPELRQLGGFVSQREAEKAAAQGEAFAADMENSKEAWDGLMKDGKIAAGQNPHFILAAKRKFGQVAASRFQVALNESLSKLGDAPTPEQFEQAVSDTRTAFLKDNAGAASNDLAFMSGFNGPAEGIIDNARRSFAAAHAQRVEEDAGRAFTAAMHHAAFSALENPNMTDADVVSAMEGQAAELAKADPRKLTQKQIADAKTSVLFALMEQTKNPTLIRRIAGKIKSGNATLADDPEFFEKFQGQVDRVTARQRAYEQDQRVKDAEAERSVIESATDTLLKSWQANGGKVDTTEVEASLAAAGVRDAHSTVQGIVAKLPELDPRFYIGYRQRVAQGKYPSIAELTAAANSGKINRVQYDGLLTDIDQAQNAERALSMAGAPTTESIWSHPAMKLLEQQIRAAAETKATRGPFGQITSYTGFTETDLEQAVAEAKIDFAQNLAANWSKYGSGAAAAELASNAWRTYALRHNIIGYQESLEGQGGPMPADKTRAKQVQQNRAAIAADITQRAMQFTDAELTEGRAVIARWPLMTDDAKRAWLTANKRRVPLFRFLQASGEAAKSDSTAKK